MIAVQHYVEQRAARAWHVALQERLGPGVSVAVTPFRIEREDRPGVVGTASVESAHLLSMDAAELQRAMQETADQAVTRMETIISQEEPMLLEMLQVLRQPPPR